MKWLMSIQDWLQGDQWTYATIFNMRSIVWDVKLSSPAFVVRIADDTRQRQRHMHLYQTKYEAMLSK